MRAVWSQHVPGEFLVRDVHRLMPELAYTTVMTTVARLARKGLLVSRPGVGGRQAHQYLVAATPAAHLERASREEAREVVRRYGDAALAAFAAQLDRLPAARREKLRRMSER